ncbi:hypothetical protein BG004_006315 [Podila humilis]|nr:hypothetical protein BG004_006315 [Podila humilis]
MSSARAAPPPLKLEVIESRPLTDIETVARLNHFLSNGTAIHSAPTSIAHQVTQVHEKLRLEAKQMAQKVIKKSNVTKDSIKKQNTGMLRKGGKSYAPKNNVLIKQKSTQKKLSAQINKNIETVMATRAGATGKLTIMKGLADAGLAAERKAGGKKKAGGMPKVATGKTIKAMPTKATK